jgi:hypothetical protein
LSLDLRKLGVLAGLAGLLLTFGIWRSDVPGRVAEASLSTPGGISALPSAAPGVPGVSDQEIPAIIRARPPGNYAVVTVFCDPYARAPAPYGLMAFFPLNCPVKGANTISTSANPELAPSGAITFEITAIYPIGATPRSTFHASGTTKLVCTDNASCDLSSTPTYYPTTDVGIVAVQLDGGGVNEILEVWATDELGEKRSVLVVVIDTMLAFGTSGPVATASQQEQLVVAYACDTVGRQLMGPDSETETVYDPRPFFGIPLTAADADLDGIAGLDDLWDLLYGYGTTFGYGLLDNAPLTLNQTYPSQYQDAGGDVDLPLYWCGGDTASPLDDSVTFQTDLGIFSASPVGETVGEALRDASRQGLLIAPFLDANCPVGNSVDVTDVDSLRVWARALKAVNGLLNPVNPGPPPPQEGGCDLDFARNGVVSYMLLGNGEPGTATITGQQGGGVSPIRTVNVVFVGEAKISLFLTAPAVVGPEGGQFMVAVVDSDFRPVASETVQCSVSPAGGALIVVPQTGTTDTFLQANPGQVAMKLVPTGKAVSDGESLVLTCVADRNRSVKAVAVMTLSSTPVTEAVALVAACNPVVSTWADDTAIETVAAAVAPAEALEAIWALNPDGTAWLGFSPAAPEGVNDLVSVDQFDAFFVCVNASATLSRPLV